MKPEVESYNKSQNASEAEICNLLATLITTFMPEAENKMWHKHPVWFLDGNPIVGYSKLKAGIRLMFWSGASFNEDDLKEGTGKFKDASILYTNASTICEEDLRRWISKSKHIQWDYKNIYKMKGNLQRLK
jgi:hypothetical protein